MPKSVAAVLSVVSCLFHCTDCSETDCLAADWVGECLSVCAFCSYRKLRSAAGRKDSGRRQLLPLGIRIPVVCVLREEQKSSRQLGEVARDATDDDDDGLDGGEMSAGKRIKRVSALFIFLLPTSTFEVEVFSVLCGPNLE